MWDTTFWRDFAADAGDYYIEVDQCTFHHGTDSARGPRKTTRLACDAGSFGTLHAHFAHCRCDGGHTHRPVLQPRRPDGSWASALSAYYSPELNHALASSLITAIRARDVRVSAILDGSPIDLVDSVISLPHPAIDRLAHGPADNRRDIARAIVHARGHVDRSADDHLD
jgi:hypothetical protein